MSHQPYRYSITDLHQLCNCESNTDPDLKIHVTDFIQNDKISGTRVSIFHPDFGVLFAYVVNGSGEMLVPDNYVHYLEAYTSLMAELHRFGFIVQYESQKYLSNDQLLYLKSLKGLHYDKLRLLVVRNPKTQMAETHIVVFNIADNPQWIDNTYSPTITQFNTSLNRGSALAIPRECLEKYNWGWLNFVADIQDILDENIGRM